jgi:hypothetical protein
VRPMLIQNDRRVPNLGQDADPILQTSVALHADPVEGWIIGQCGTSQRKPGPSICPVPYFVGEDLALLPVRSTRVGDDG